MLSNRGKFTESEMVCSALKGQLVWLGNISDVKIQHNLVYCATDDTANMFVPAVIC